MFKPKLVEVHTSLKCVLSVEVRDEGHTLTSSGGLISHQEESFNEALPSKQSFQGVSIAVLREVSDADLSVIVLVGLAPASCADDFIRACFAARGRCCCVNGGRPKASDNTDFFGLDGVGAFEGVVVAAAVVALDNVFVLTGAFTGLPDDGALEDDAVVVLDVGLDEVAELLPGAPRFDGLVVSGGHGGTLHCGDCGDRFFFFFVVVVVVVTVLWDCLGCLTVVYLNSRLGLWGELTS